MSSIVSNLNMEKINLLCADIRVKTGFDYFVMYMVFNNGQRFVLSNMYNLLEEYYGEEYYKEDYSYHPSIISRVDHYICSNTMSVSDRLKEYLESKVNIHRAYYTVRSCPEVQFVFGAARNTRMDDIVKVYKNSIDDFNSFCVEFVDGASEIIKNYFPVYKNALFISDRKYLKKIIFGSVSQTINQKELEVLYWAANGKSTDEIALILGKSKQTVEEQKKSIRKKLNVSNMTQAVFEGIKQGYIGAFSQGWGLKESMVTYPNMYLSPEAKDTTISLINSSIIS